MGRPVVQTKTLAAASANNLATSQALAGAGNLNLNGVAAGLLDTQRRVIITSAGDDHLLTWTVTGTNDSGAAIKDSFAGSNGGAAQSNLDFKTVTQISGSGATAGNVTAGTNTVGSTPWVRADPHLGPFYISLNGELLTGAANWQVDYTNDEFLAAPGAQPAIQNAPANFVPQALLHPVLQNEAGNAQGAIDFPVLGYRLTINSGTGKVQLTGTQAGLAGP